MIIGPWHARYGDHRENTADGICRMISVTADGGRASRVVAWDQIRDHTPVHHLAPDGSAVPADETVTYDHHLVSVYGRGPVPAAMPLALLASDDTGWIVYLPIRLDDRDGLFFRVATLDLPTTQNRPPPQAVLTAVLAELPSYSRTAGSHECWYFKHDPDMEYEHKFTLDPDTDIYTLARAITDHVGRGDLTRYRPEYRNDFELWQFDNHLFGISGPLESDHGYVSFISRLNGGYTVKRKKFRHDGFRRCEDKKFWPATEASRGQMKAHLTDELGLDAEYLGSFERIRFDNMLESAETGHIYSIVTDRCLVHASDAILQQIEIEYIRSRGDTRDCGAEILAELEQLRTWVRDFLIAHGVDHDTDYTSKYTFLRRLSFGPRNA